jgi:hypothetical protein
MLAHHTGIEGLTADRTTCIGPDAAAAASSGSRRGPWRAVVRRIGIDEGGDTGWQVYPRQAAVPGGGRNLCNGPGADTRFHGIRGRRHGSGGGPRSGACGRRRRTQPCEEDSPIDTLTVLLKL